ncbi:MAG: GNAT family N-acetyltransferase [Candidatus Eremiobacteraeota bacterium]|nr:GNAT family N-acetyltransferase [Candidatus Eremiobacteraeota bacterium]
MALIRQARPEDADAILTMARALAEHVGDPPPASKVRQFVDDCFGPKRWFECFVAEHQNELVGFVSVSRGAEVHTGRRRLWVGDLYVAPRARRFGVARDLLRAVVRQARELNCSAVYWEVWRSNDIGSAFFQAVRSNALEDLTIMRLDVDRPEL